VVIVDDCSKENIPPIICRIKNEFPALNLRFYQNNPNLGFDKNVLRVISLAKGDYCWLLSNDDQILPGAVKRILKLVNEHVGLSLINANYTRFDNLLQKTTSDKMVDLRTNKHFVDANMFFFYQTNSSKSYFKYLGVNTLTMSTDIFNRAYWNSFADINHKYIGHNFIHIFIIAQIINEHPDIYFLAKPQVQYLANNHRVWPNDIWKDLNHFFIDHLINLGYDKNLCEKMRKDHKVYERKEAIIKSKFLSGAYRQGLNIIGKVDQVFNSWKK